MNTQIFRNAARMSRWLMGSAALAIFAAAAPVAAFAQGKSNIAGCSTFSSFTYDVATNTLNVSNCGGTTPVQTAGTFSWAASTATIDANATAPLVVRVNRNGLNGSNAGFYVVDYTVSASSAMTGWWFNGSRSGGQFAFGDGVAFVDLGFMPGGVAGTVTVTLTAVSAGTGMAVGGATTLTINVTTPGGGGNNPPPPPIGCSTNSNYTNSFTVVGQKFVYSLKPGETAATAFVPKAGTSPELSTSDTVNTPPGADHEIVISKCPGDFTGTSMGAAAPLCRLNSLYKGGVVRTTATGSPFWYCTVNAGETYYMNVRQVKYDNTSVNSCDFASCEIKVQVQNY
jgi:hypothetical protein